MAVKWQEIVAMLWEVMPYFLKSVIYNIKLPKSEHYLILILVLATITKHIQIFDSAW
jgi:hypothetical protein